MAKVIIEKYQELVRQYKTLFDGDIDAEVRAAINKCIKKMVLRDNHKDVKPLKDPIHDKLVYKACFIEGETRALTDCINVSNIDKLKQVISIFNAFEDSTLCKEELEALYNAINKANIEYAATKNLLQAATKELFGSIVQNHPEIAGFQELYDQTIELLGSNEEQ